MVVTALFAAAAAGLVLVGIFGVVAYAESREVRDIGVRLALGAGKWQVVTVVLRRSLIPILAGLAIGLIASTAAGRVLEGQLWRVSPHDPLALGLSALIVALLALAACYVPARRALPRRSPHHLAPGMTASHRGSAGPATHARW